MPARVLKEHAKSCSSPACAISAMKKTGLWLKSLHVPPPAVPATERLAAGAADSHLMVLSGSPRFWPTAARAVTVAFALLASGCTETGDLGRPRPSIWNATVYPTAGGWLATMRGEPSSWFHQTDDEVVLRNRAFRFISPAHERSLFDRQISELARTRILPVEAQSITISAYWTALRGGDFRSPASRYRRLAEDAHADRLLIAPFRQITGRVVSADRVRLRTAEGSPWVPPQHHEPAVERVVENEGLVRWVRERLHYRILSYRFALDNLVVEMPASEAIIAERAIMALEAEAKGFERISEVGVFRHGPLVTK